VVGRLALGARLGDGDDLAAAIILPTPLTMSIPSGTIRPSRRTNLVAGNDHGEHHRLSSPLV
jgi:hypothetical protein